MRHLKILKIVLINVVILPNKYLLLIHDFVCGKTGKTGQFSAGFKS